MGVVRDIAHACFEDSFVLICLVQCVATTECEMASINGFALALPEGIPEHPHQPDAG